MSVRGWIYVLSNPAMIGLVKIGFSTKDPVLRVEELNHTGLPAKFVIEYDALIYDPHEIEQQVHKRLKDCRYNNDREFFACSPAAAVIAIREICCGKILLENKNNNLEASFLPHIAGAKCSARDLSK